MERERTTEIDRRRTLSTGPSDDHDLEHQRAEVDALLHRHVIESTGRRYLLRVFDEMGLLMQRCRYLGFRDAFIGCMRAIGFTENRAAA